LDDGNGGGVMLRLIGFIIALLVAILGASFAYLNFDPVTVNLWVRSYEIGLPWVVFLALALGWILGILSVAGIIIKQLARIRRLKRAVKLAETEISNLRSIPIRNAH